MEQKEVEKSFVDYFIEKEKIDTKTVQCIRTIGWGKDAVLRVEYADFHKDYKPVRLAKAYLKEFFGLTPKNINFNNGHYDRIGCSALNIWDISDRQEYEQYLKMPAKQYVEYEIWDKDEKGEFGNVEFQIHNEKQCELCYADKLYEYFIVDD